MQFNDDDLNLDNVGSPADDSDGEISWEDLLNADNDVDVLNVVKHQDKEEENNINVSENSANNSDFGDVNLDLGHEENLSLDLGNNSFDIGENEISLDLGNNEEESNQNFVPDTNSITFHEEVNEEIENSEGFKTLDTVEDNNIDNQAGSYINSFDNIDTNIEYVSDNENNNDIVNINDFIDEESLDEKNEDVSDEKLLNILNNESNDDVSDENNTSDGGDIFNILSSNSDDNNEQNGVNLMPVPPVAQEDNEEQDGYYKDSQEEENAQYEAPKGNPQKEKILVILVVIVFLGVLIFGAYSAISFIKKHFDTDEIVAGNGSKKTIEIQTDGPNPMDGGAVPISFDKDGKPIPQADIEALKKDKLANKDGKATLRMSDKKDERIVVYIGNSGRPNPFLPARYIGDFDDSPYEAVPPYMDEAESDEMKEVKDMLSITVSGIMYDATKPSAILKYDDSEYFVQKGDRVNNYLVTNIAKDYVTIKNNGNTYNAFVGEAFAPEEKDKDKDKETRQFRSGGHRYYVVPKEDTGK